MRFAHTVVSEVGFRDPEHNPHRLGLLGKCLGRLADDGVTLALLPAGFLSVREESSVEEQAVPVAEVAARHGVTVVAGVDVIDPTLLDEAEVDDLVREGRLPFFGFATSDPGLLWRQTSVTNADAELTPEDDLPGSGRVIDVQGYRVGVLLCGELFSWRARESLADAPPDLIADLGHRRMRQGLIPAMRSLARAAGRPVVHSHHLAGWYGRSVHYVDAQGVQHSISTEDCPWVGDDNFWIAWAVRSI